MLCISAIIYIRAGTEITYDYAFEMVGELRGYFCGSHNCRGTTNKPTRSTVRLVYRVPKTQRRIVTSVPKCEV